MRQGSRKGHRAAEGLELGQDLAGAQAVEGRRQSWRGVRGRAHAIDGTGDVSRSPGCGVTFVRSTKHKGKLSEGSQQGVICCDLCMLKSLLVALQRTD